MDIISYYMIINYLNYLLKAATPLRVISGRQRQAATNFDISPYSVEPCDVICITSICLEMGECILPGTLCSAYMFFHTVLE